jgi:hypothetical protein
LAAAVLPWAVLPWAILAATIPAAAVPPRMRVEAVRPPRAGKDAGGPCRAGLIGGFPAILTARPGNSTPDPALRPAMGSGNGRRTDGSLPASSQRGPAGRPGRGPAWAGRRAGSLRSRRRPARGPAPVPAAPRPPPPPVPAGRLRPPRAIRDHTAPGGHEKAGRPPPGARLGRRGGGRPARWPGRLSSGRRSRSRGSGCAWRSGGRS